MEKFYECLDSIVEKLSNFSSANVKKEIESLEDSYDKLYVSGKILSEIKPLEYNSDLVSFLGNTIIEASEKAREYSMTDSLTGLLNKGNLDFRLKTELASHYRNDKNPFSVIMFDIDHFKKFNDVYGHNAGNSVLKTLGNLVSNNIRESDSAFRYGGEEFVILLYDTCKDGALNVAHNLNYKIANTEMSFLDKNYKENKESINISAGVTEINKNDPVWFLYGKSGKDLVEKYISESSNFNKCLDHYLVKQENGLTRENLKNNIKEISGFVKSYTMENNIDVRDISTSKVAGKWVIEKADKLMYHTKTNGRNNVSYMDGNYIRMLK